MSIREKIRRQLQPLGRLQVLPVSLATAAVRVMSTDQQERLWATVGHLKFEAYVAASNAWLMDNLSDEQWNEALREAEAAFYCR